MQKLMLEYVDFESPTRLSKLGMDSLNQYAARGAEIIRDTMSGKPSSLEVFIREYFMYFKTDEFFTIIIYLFNHNDDSYRIL